MYFLSCHRDVEHIGRGWSYRKDWVSYAADSMASVAQTVTRFAWSPCQWFGGHRLTGNFGRANLFALDFDSGELSLAQAKNIFSDCIHVIGTTKSHQKEKGGITCDRFRVILQLEHETDDAELFAATVRFYASKWDADLKAADAARFFWPCERIVSVMEDGYSQEFVRPDPEFRGPPTERYRKSGAVRLRSQAMLRRPVPAGERNNFCFTVAKDLFDAGYQFREIYDIILRSPTYQGPAPPHHVLQDITQCIRSAIKSVETGRAYGGRDGSRQGTPKEEEEGGRLQTDGVRLQPGAEDESSASGS
jgi:hypothetical protein